MKNWEKLLYGLLSLLFACLWTAHGDVKIELKGEAASSVPVRISVKDLKKHLPAVSDSQDWNYAIDLDKTVTDGSFGYKMEAGCVKLTGGDGIGASHAIYTFLEDLGYTFDVTGISSSGQMKKVSQLKDRSITPRVRWRGIRQHVNFPMDISSYPIKDARAYIDSLFRMRFNKLTIHSYPGQWYETQIAGQKKPAGNFFYGDTHHMGGSEILKKHIPSNKEIFCIPAAEACFSDVGARSKVAVAWMQELINYAKDLGFYVQFSFEPRMASLEDACQTARDIRNTYPRIDALELMTEETGGWGPRCTAEEVEKTLKTCFPEEIANNEAVRQPIRPRQSDLNALYAQLGLITKVIGRLQTEGRFGPELKLGIYCSVADYMKGAYRLARLALPETKVCLMPSHGSDGTASATASLIGTSEDLRKTELYSWIEFDGLMYLYQNSIAGNARLMEHLEKLLPQDQLDSLAYNHWRTAENRTSARYAMESTLKGKRTPDVFYKDYAGRMGIGDTAKYEKILNLVGQADSFAKVHLGNIGFCWVGAWRSGGSFTSMNRENIRTARKYYFEAGQLLSDIIAQMDKGSSAYSYLSFMGNRVLCSILYLDAFSEAAELQTIHREKEGNVSPAEQSRAREICNHALLMFDQYMTTHARMLPDRGCEGTLVSLWNAPIRGLKVYRARMGGVPPEELPHSDKPVDAPPLPIFYEQTKN